MFSSACEACARAHAGGRAVRVRFGAASLCSGKTLWEKAVASSLLGGHMLMLMLMLVASLCSGKTLWEKAVASSHPRPMLMWRGSILATWAERVGVGKVGYVGKVKYLK